MADTITLPAGVYTLTRPGAGEEGNATSDLDVTSEITINGIDRVLQVLSSSNLTVQNVQIRFGLAGYGAAPHINGGGVYIAKHGLLTVFDSAITDNWGANSRGAPAPRLRQSISSTASFPTTTATPSAAGCSATGQWL